MRHPVQWLAAVIAACHLATPSISSGKPFKVGLLTPGPISDKGWNAGAYEGLMAIKEKLGAKVSHVQVKSPAEHEEQFRSYAEEGYDLVFGHGFEFQDAAKRVGRDFPHTIFITTSGNTVTGNVGAMRFELEEATYLLGVIAGRMTQSGVIGMIGGVEIPSVESTFLAYEGGAKSVRPECVALRTFTGSWQDTALARDATLAQISKGADFFFHNANEAGPGVFQAVTENKDKGVYVFGSNKDQNKEAPEVILGSAVIDLPGAFVRLAEQVQKGAYQAGVTRFGLKSGVISLVYSPSLLSKIPQLVLDEVEALREKMEAGELQAPRGDF